MASSCHPEALLQSQMKKASLSSVATHGQNRNHRNARMECISEQSANFPSPVDDELSRNLSIGDGVFVNRGYGREKLTTASREEKKRTKWENLFSGSAVATLTGGWGSGAQLPPRRSAPQSVVAAESIALPADRTQSRGSISVVSSVTHDTSEIRLTKGGYCDHTGPSNQTMQKSKVSSILELESFRPPKRHLRNAFPKRSSYYSDASYVTNSKASSAFEIELPSKPRPKLLDKDFRLRSDGPFRDSEIIGPPTYRSRGGKDSDDTQEPCGQNTNSGKKWSVLGAMGNQPDVGGFSFLNATGLHKLSPLSESLVDAGGEGDDIPSKVPTSDGFSSMLRSLLSNQMFFYGLMFFFMATGLLYGVLSNTHMLYRLRDFNINTDWDEELSVAFIGNSYLFINDIPRIMEALSEDHIYQESVIHSSGGSLNNLLLTGNGMYPRWKTDEAILDSYVNENGNNVTIYDYGLCTVAQILEGKDDILSYGNEDGAYYNDGKNPCIRNQNYFYYVQDKLDSSSFVWDYVVLVDQTKRMAVEEARQQSIYALSKAYGPLIEATGAIPVIVDTHAFWSDSTNMTGLVDIPTFQALIYDGVLDYVEALANVLPDWQTPVVAPVGLAFLVVYEENYNLWRKLFIDDDIHSSVYGSYLFSCVLYATLYGHLPRQTINSQTETIFAKSRLLVGQDIEYPSADEAYYLWLVAKRVALDGYIPRSMRR